ncbi:serine hydrolase domain-containing protein [Chlorobium sp. N1]|uniref:serine hydrolase domain-containing protein n=1 Tax=Chlorobium sp. N1 TaxID=2491138 RepID=UPI00103B3D2C|nr:serine hydrolase domain-containing protein [Chlorobium sp. N1]TCD47610.1 class A beta-lactamase-related serine hydrolase [Chlorobium sp. N1]
MCASRFSRSVLLALLLWIAAGAAAPLRASEPDFSALRRLAEDGVKEGVFPGASIAVVHRGKTLFHEAFGTTGCDRNPEPAYTSTIYDLASLTKAVATTSVVMQLVERDSLDLGRPAADYLPAFGRNGKEKVTLRQLLRHTSGLRAHAWYIETCRSAGELIEAVYADTLLSRPGLQTAYSDNGFIVLGRIIEKVTGRSLAENFHARFALPLGMRRTCFNPPAGLQAEIAPTGRDTAWGKGLGARPLVNDQNAAILGGVAGHAGLFSTTGDLTRFMRMLMNGGKLDGVRYFRKSTVKEFTRRRGDDERALGWDLRSREGYSSAGGGFSEDSWGHLGYTGTSIWVDPEKELAVIMLSNRVCPDEENRKIRDFRPRLHNAAARALGYDCPPYEPPDCPLR